MFFLSYNLISQSFLSNNRRFPYYDFTLSKYPTDSKVFDSRYYQDVLHPLPFREYEKFESRGHGNSIAVAPMSIIVYTISLLN